MTGTKEKISLLALGPVSVFLVTFLLELLSFALLKKQTNSLFILALISPAALPLLIYNDRRSLSALYSVIASTILIIASFYLAGSIYDTSFDGQTYHQLAVDYLKGGWNFFLGDRGTISELKPEYQLPLLHYPKFPWLVESTIYGVTGSIEGAKSLNLILFLCSGLLTYVAAQRLYPNNKKTSLLLASALFLNPVSICQLWNSYIDGILASVTLFVFSALCLYFSTQKSVWAHVAGISALILLHVKFTAIAILASLCFVLLIGAIRRSYSCLHSLKIIIFYLFLGVAIVGFHPYLTNLLTTGNLVYPIAGYSPIGRTPPPDEWPVFAFVKGQQPSVLTNLPGPIKTALSVLSKAGNPVDINEPYSPFYLITFSDFGRFVVPDLRLGGFGPLFAFSLVASFSALVSRNKSTHATWMVAFIGAILFSSLLNPESWWSRYCPQLWFLPMAIAALGRDTKILQFISIILIINSTTILYVNTKNANAESKKVEDLLTRIEHHRGESLYGESKNFYSNELRLKNLDITLKKPTECINKEYFAGSPSYICLP